MTMKKNELGGLFIDPIPNSPILHLKNCMGNSKENYLLDLGSARVTEFHFKRNSVKRQIFLPNWKITSRKLYPASDLSLSSSLRASPSFSWGIESDSSQSSVNPFKCSPTPPPRSFPHGIKTCLYSEGPDSNICNLRCQPVNLGKHLEGFCSKWVGKTLWLITPWFTWHSPRHYTRNVVCGSSQGYLFQQLI